MGSVPVIACNHFFRNKTCHFTVFPLQVILLVYLFTINFGSTVVVLFLLLVVDKNFTSI